ncbi:MAG: hypothetical protein MJ134_02830 [Lachnospiraceae bacterium]|nr:hypothetical protein [Lachnospiraceae bacterium]
MADNTIFVKHYPSDFSFLPINRSEMARYSGYKSQADEQVDSIMDEVIFDLQDAFSYKVCYRRMELLVEDGRPKLPFSFSSKSLEALLTGCSEIIIFAATIGIGIDRYIKKEMRLSPTKGLFAQGFGAERIETLCDYFCNQIKEAVFDENLTCTARYSPGYGDLPLEVQKDIFALLDCSRQIGVSLNESLLMSPSKSVTAIFGLKEASNGCDSTSPERNKCKACSNNDCAYRNSENN